MFQGGKRHSSLFRGAFQVDSNYFLLHRHFKVVAVVFERGSLTSGSKYSDMTCKLGILENWSLWRGGRLRVVVATGGSTVLSINSIQERMKGVRDNPPYRPYSKVILSSYF